MIKAGQLLSCLLILTLCSCAVNRSSSTSPLSNSSVTKQSTLQTYCIPLQDIKKPALDGYIQKVDSFELIFDPSASMSEHFQEVSKFQIASCLAESFDHTIPDITLQAALRSFGNPVYTSLDYGIEKFDAIKFANCIKGITQAKGASPLEFALRKFTKDMEELKGKTALIIFSDGKNLQARQVEVAAERLVRLYPDRLCIYPVLIGNDPAGIALFKKLAHMGNCGFFSRAKDIASASAMADFVKKIFLTPDSDQDGVPDNCDACPNTPAGAPVDTRGCVRDADRDGVWDSLDRCPNTPKGAQVDKHGCWKKGEVLFDFDKYNIKPQYYKVLDNIARVMSLNPGLKIRIEGHADIIGLEHYNVLLSMQRASSAKAYLVNKGISSKRISTTGFGYFKPRFKNDTPAHRALNRRVEFKIVSF